MHKLSVLMNKSNGSLLTLLLLICLITISQYTLAGEKEKKDIDRIESFDDLFGTPQPSKEKPETKTEIIQKAASQTTQDTVKSSPASESRFTGFYQNDLAYTYGEKAHLSRFNNTVDFSTQGRTDIGIEWKIGGRVMYDATFDLTNFYPGPVRKDQRFEVKLREAYFDFSAAGLDFRLGRQHIVWGEMVGLFFADVVSAKDLRQLVLPDFDMIRIPQWAIRAEYFEGDWHAEAVWIPYMSYDNIGKPGAEFYPFNPPAITGMQTVIAADNRPNHFKDMSYGARLSYLKNGWDISGFYYTANDPAAAFSRSYLSPTTILYEPIHQRIHQVGATLGKDLGPMVLKGEAIYTKDKLFNTKDMTDTDGLIKQDILDYIVGLEWSFPHETRFNVQFFQRWYTNHKKNLYPSELESGASVMLTTQALHPKVEPEILFIRSLNRDDWNAQLKVSWRMDGNWRLTAGADIFSGPATGLFGQFDKKDRVYTELRYSF